MALMKLTKHFVEPNELGLVSLFNLVRYQLVKNIYEKKNKAKRFN